MRVGIALGPEQPNVATEARWAEAAGFDQVAIGEHLFFHGPTTNGFVALAAAAGGTERIRLLSALTIAPVYPLAVLAKLVASLDQASAGRFDFGVGVGGEYPPEFVAAGVDVRERGARTEEQLADSLAQVNAQATQLGRPEGAVRGAVYCWGAVHTSWARARQSAIDVVSTVYQQDFTPLADRYLLHGDPDRVVRRLREYHDAGARDLVFSAASLKRRCEARRADPTTSS